MQSQKANVVIIGHVDHGKSTLIGRLLYDSGSLQDEKIEEVKKTAEKLGKEMEFAFFIDSLEEEREDAMTIDIMHIPLKINNRDYLLIDCPGHKELIKNMLSGASEAHSAILVISAKRDEGVQEQTKRHLFLAKMLGIEQIFIAVNKMDEVSYSKERFDEIQQTLNEFLKKLNFYSNQIFFIPISAKLGENIFKKSERMEWYNRECLTELLEKNVSAQQLSSAKPFIGLVQDIYNIKNEKIVIVKVEEGRISVNDNIIFNLSQHREKIAGIKIFGEKRNFAEAGESVGLEIKNLNADDIKRGEVASKVILNKTKNIEARIFVLSELSLNESDSLQIICGTAERECKLFEIEEKIDSSTCEKIRGEKREIGYTETALVLLKLSEPITAEKFSEIPVLGRFLLIKNNKIVAAGIIKSTS